MQISELAHHTQVPVGTIKYYLRCELLHPGQAIGPRRALYDESHVTRLRLLRALREIGDMPIGRMKSVIAALAEGQAAPDVVTAAMPTPTADRAESSAQEPDAAAATLARMITKSGKWEAANVPAQREFVALLDAASGTHASSGVPHEVIDACVKAANLVAEAEAASMTTPQESLYRYTIVTELLGALRNVALSHHLKTGDNPAEASITLRGADTVIDLPLQAETDVECQP